MEDPANKGRITDFLSFFTIFHTVNNHPNHSFIKVAYSFYNVSTATLLVDLMADVLVLAKRENFDVFNALDLMGNNGFFRELKFGKGDGALNYYLSDWRCPKMNPSKMGLVLRR